MSETNKNRGGRPRVDATPITVRVPPEMLEYLDRFIHEHNMVDGRTISRPEAIRTILNIWMTRHE